MFENLPISGQNPPGYRGMERDTTLFPPDTGRPPADADTADTSATDTSGVQNPPGYRGMERDTTLVPSDTGRPPAEAGQVEDRATGTYDDSTWQDTTGAEQNPAGYRGTGMLEDSAAAGEDSTTVGDTEPKENQTAEPRIEPSEGAADDTTSQ
jgi:hypothetical protein